MCLSLSWFQRSAVGLYHSSSLLQFPVPDFFNHMEFIWRGAGKACKWINKCSNTVSNYSFDSELPCQAISCINSRTDSSRSWNSLSVIWPWEISGCLSASTQQCSCWWPRSRFRSWSQLQLQCPQTHIPVFLWPLPVSWRWSNFSFVSSHLIFEVLATVFLILGNNFQQLPSPVRDHFTYLLYLPTAT